MFDWMTDDQIDFVSDAANKHAEAWVEKKYPNASNTEKKQKMNELKILSYTAAQKRFNLDVLTWQYKAPSTLLMRLLAVLDDFVDNNQVSQMYLRDASKWFSFWAEQLSKKESVIKDQEKYLDAMRNNDCTDNLFHRNGPLEAEPCAREVKEE